MDKPSFPAPWATRPRAPITPDAARRVLAAALAGVAATVTALVLAGALSGWALLVAAAALLALPGARYGWGLLETVAPLPDVRTPRHALDDDLLAVAVASGAEGRHTTRVGVHSVRALAESDAPTTAIPQVTA